MKSLKGQLLVASPALLAPIFARSVILMCEHSPQGAMGIILNRQTEATVRDIAEQVLKEPLDWEKPIGLGGPVQGPLIVVHREARLADQTIIEGLYSAIDASKVQQVLREQLEPCLVLANYSGWGPGQLEGEMEEGSWLTWPASDELVFRDDTGALWDDVMQQIRAAELARMLGIENLPRDPSTN